MERRPRFHYPQALAPRISGLGVPLGLAIEQERREWKECACHHSTPASLPKEAQ